MTVRTLCAAFLIVLTVSPFTAPFQTCGAAASVLTSPGVSIAGPNDSPAWSDDAGPVVESGVIRWRLVRSPLVHQIAVGPRAALLAVADHIPLRQTRTPLHSLPVQLVALRV